MTRTRWGGRARPTPTERPCQVRLHPATPLRAASALLLATASARLSGGMTDLTFWGCRRLATECAPGTLRRPCVLAGDRSTARPAGTRVRTAAAICVTTPEPVALASVCRLLTRYYRSVRHRLGCGIADLSASNTQDAPGCPEHHRPDCSGGVSAGYRRRGNLGKPGEGMTTFTIQWCRRERHRDAGPPMLMGCPTIALVPRRRRGKHLVEVHRYAEDGRRLRAGQLVPDTACSGAPIPLPGNDICGHPRHDMPDLVSRDDHRRSWRVWTGWSERIRRSL